MKHFTQRILVLVLGLATLGATAAPKDAALRARFLTMFARGYYPSRSGQLFVVPREGQFVSSTDSTRYYFMHGSPWDYDSAIPLLFYGPRYVRAGREKRSARQQDVMPTLAAFLHLEGLPATVTGHDLQVRRSDVTSTPRIVALIVLDGMRADYLRRPENEIPNLSRLVRDGAYFPNAHVDYLPTNTAVGHSTIATGSDPRFHGVVGNGMFDTVRKHKHEPFVDCDPERLLVPSLSDLWNAATRGRAEILVAGGNVRAGTPLAGHGACFFNGKRTQLAVYDENTGKWTAGGDTCFALPPHLHDWTELHPGSDAPNRIGLAMDNPKSVRHSPRFARFEANAAIAMIESDSLCGADAIPDLILINLKTVDFVGHSYGADSPEIRDAIAAVDSQIGRIVEVVSKKAGGQDFVVAITADHGMPSGNRGQPDLAGRRHISQDSHSAIRELLNAGEPNALVQHYDGEDAQVFILPGDPQKTPAYYARKLRAQKYIFAVFTEEEVRRAANALR